MDPKSRGAADFPYYVGLREVRDTTTVWVEKTVLTGRILDHRFQSRGQNAQRLVDRPNLNPNRL